MPGIDFNKNNNRLLTTSPYYYACVWDIANKKILFKLEGHTAKLTSAKYSPNDRFILTTSEDHTAKLWTLQKAGCFLHFSQKLCPDNYQNSVVCWVDEICKLSYHYR